MININLSNKVAIVTGGASGLGKSIALRFAEAGASVVVADIQYEQALATAKELERFNITSAAYSLNVTHPSEFEGLIEFVLHKFGKIDIMINNAGIGNMKPITTFTTEEIEKLIDINLKGTIYGTKAVLPHMISRKEGKIINMSSIAAKLGSPYSSIYAASKSGVIALSNSLAREVAEHNININVICPGIIRTNMWENQLNNMTQNGDSQSKNQAFSSYTDMIPLKRPQEPVDIANAALFLCSDLATNITAQTLNVDGGCAIF